MNVTIGKYTLMVVCLLCFIPCYLLLIAGWLALGLPKVLSVVAPSLMIIGVFKLFDRKWIPLKDWLNGEYPESVKLGSLTLQIVRAELSWNRRRKFYFAVVFLTWLLIMISFSIFGAAQFGESVIIPCVAVSVALLILLVNQFERSWRP